MNSPSKTWAAGLFLLFCALSPGRVTSWDTAVRQAVSRSLWQHGSVFVSPEVKETAGMVYVEKRGGYTSFYGIGQTIALIPFDMAAFALSKLAPPEGKAAAYLAMLPIVFLYAPLVVLLWWLGIVMLLEEGGIPARRARLFAALFVTSTIAVFYIAQSVQEESLVGTLVTWGLVFALRWRRAFSPRHAFLAGLLFASALAFRPTAVFAWLPLLGLGAETFLHDRKLFFSGVKAIALGAVPPLLVHCAFAYLRFGSPFALGYDLAAQKDHLVLWKAPDLAVFLGMLAGPGKGLLLLSPGLWLVFPGMREAVKRHPFMTAGAALAVLGSLFLHAMRGLDPDGSICWATRYQTHLLGFLALPAAYGWEKISKRAALALFAVSFLVVGMGMTASDNLEYLQAEADGMTRTTLVTSLSRGQLPRRAGTVLARLAGRSPSPGAGPEWKARIDRMAEDYTPNLWGPAYAKKSDKASVRFAMLALWLAQLAAALALLVKAARRDSAPEAAVETRKMAA